jgi:hypothetical protein
MMTSPKYLEPGTLVLVEWHDAHSYDPWLPHDDPEKERILTLEMCETVGWVTRHDEKSIALHASHNAGNDGATWVIPGGMVVTIKRLSVAKGRK